MNGWEAGIGVNFNKWVGAEGDVSGYYEHLGTVAGGDVGAHDYIVAGGPRVTVKPVFFHALIGVDRFTSYVNANGSIFVSSSSISQSSLAVLFGGGVEWKIWHHVALRPSLDYVLTRRGSPTRLTQNNVRLGAAIEYAFGR